MLTLATQADVNLWAAWVGILAGMIAGATQGLHFHRVDFLGGYDSWRRRLVRLGHISFFGLAGVNLAFAVTADHLAGRGTPLPHLGVTVASILLIAGAVLMPTVCYLAAWRQPMRHLFVLPVTCLIAGVGTLIVTGVLETSGFASITCLTGITP